MAGQDRKSDAELERLRADAKRLYEELLTQAGSGPNDRLHNPVDRYGQLDPDTREFLEDLRPLDTATLRKVIDGYRGAQIIGTFLKRVSVALVAGAGMAWAFGEKLWMVVAWLQGRGH